MRPLGLLSPSLVHTTLLVVRPLHHSVQPSSSAPGTALGP